MFENVSGLPRAYENVLQGSLSDSGRAGEPMLKRLVSECCSRSSRAGELVLNGAVSEFGSRVTCSGRSGHAAVSEMAAHATAGESEEIIGLHVSHSSFDNSSNSLGCDAAVACARLPAVPGVLARVCAVSSSSAVSAAVAHARSTPMHVAHNSWSDTVRSQGSTGRRSSKGGNFRSGRRFASCPRGGGRGKFSAGRPGTGAGCRFTSWEATRNWYQVKQGECGHTFPPPGGS